MINTCSGVKRNCPPKIPTKLYISGYKCVCICAYTHLCVCIHILQRYQSCMVGNSVKNRFYCITMPLQFWSSSRLIQILDYFCSQGTILLAFVQGQRISYVFACYFIHYTVIKSISSGIWHAPLTVRSVFSPSGKVLLLHVHSWVEGLVTSFH